MKKCFRAFAEEPLRLATVLPWLLLLPLSLLFGVIVRLRSLAYRWRLFPSYRPPCPVISVGNLTLGGTGKTPVVDLLLRQALLRGERPAIISRGYGGKIGNDVGIVSRGDGSPPLLPADLCGDEPFLLSRRNPRAIVVVARRRARAIETAISECGATLIILDDGFQHLAVERDLDLLLLDARRPLGNGSLFPAGLLREPASSHRRADLCLLTRDETLATSPPFPELPTLRCRHCLSPELLALDGSKRPARELQGLKGIAFAGIALPAPFFVALHSLGLELIATLSLPDHAIFDAATREMLHAGAGSADFFVTTEKDGVKVRPGDFDLPCYQALLLLEFSQEGGLEQVVDDFLKRMRRP